MSTSEEEQMLRLMNLAGLLAPIVAFSFIFAATFVHSSWFTWPGHALSALGSHQHDPNWIYNLGLALAGVLGVIFAIRLFGYFEHLVSRLGSLSFMVGIFNLTLVGVFHGGMDYHNLVTMLFYTLSFLGVLVIGIGEVLDGDRLGYAWIIGVIVGLILTYLASQTFDGAAIPEMVGAVLYAIFSVTYFVRLEDIGWLSIGEESPSQPDL
ncbi:MAG: DUF998 domain-containing protein [Natrialbaceae archaeon]|nr:DUF998 domain-containing protein [Natrialbaceae archaeon]